MMSTHSTLDSENGEPGNSHMDVEHAREMPRIAFGEWTPRDREPAKPQHGTLSAHLLVKYQPVLTKNNDINLHVDRALLSIPRPVVNRPTARHQTHGERADGVRHNSGRDLTPDMLNANTVSILNQGTVYLTKVLIMYS